MGAWRKPSVEGRSFPIAVLAVMPVLPVLTLVTEDQRYLLAAAILIPVFLLALWAATLSQRREAPQSRYVSHSEAIAALQTGLAMNEASHGAACVFLEIDEFDKIEADWGHAGKAEILDAVSQRIFSFLRADDVLLRPSDARIAVVLPSVRRPELSAVLSLIERVQAAFAEPILIDGASAYVSLSAGFCLDVTAPARTGLKIIEAAEAALEEARSYAPSAVRGFSGRNRQMRGAPSALVEDFLAAIKEGHIKAWFQPQVSTDTGEVTGFEALARWDDPERGLVAPSEFLPALEQDARLEDLSDVMVDNALKALRSWDRAGLRVPSVAVNFATQELRNPSLIERIKWDLDRYDLTPDRMTIEILETVISDTHDDVIARNIRALSEAGFRVDLDDFGKGSASLANIKRFRVGRIKIDRSFVTNVDHDPEQQQMIAGIVALADRLGVETLAEGVESIAEKSFLSQIGCTALQGYAIARPMPFEDTIPWLSAHRQKLRNTIDLTRRAM